MADTILVTGGAGFIGRRVVRALLAAGHRVRILDSLLEQVHGQDAGHGDLDPDAELIEGDIRDGEAVTRALRGIDKVVHLAAEVGVGQSMYAIERYVGANDLGTAVLFQRLVERPVARVVVASSMSIYGEGLYRSTSGDFVEDAVRGARMAGEGWDPVDAAGRPLVPVPTPEWKRPSLVSVYALTKYVQERLTLTLAGAYGMEGVALRLFNVFGPGQALSNPYTGVLAIFAARLLNGQRPVIFEDGQQRRDFVHVDDVARAFVLALETPGIGGRVFNIGSGEVMTVETVAHALARAMGRPEIGVEITRKARTGDIRHCVADITLAREAMGYHPERPFAQAIGDLVDWVARQTAQDRVEEARRELDARGLVA